MPSPTTKQVYEKHELNVYKISQEGIVVIPLYMDDTYGLCAEAVQIAKQYNSWVELKNFIKDNKEYVDLINSDPEMVHSFSNTGYKRVLIPVNKAYILLPKTWAQMNYNVWADIEVQKRENAPGIIFGTGSWDSRTLLLHNNSGLGHSYYNRNATAMGLTCKGMNKIDVMELRPTSAVINGVSVSQSNSSNSNNNSVQLKVFGSNQTSYYAECGIAKLFFGSGNTTDYRMYPHIDSNGKACLVDISTGTKYYSAISSGYFRIELVENN